MNNKSFSKKQINLFINLKQILLFYFKKNEIRRNLVRILRNYKAIFVTFQEWTLSVFHVIYKCK